MNLFTPAPFSFGFSNLLNDFDDVLEDQPEIDTYCKRVIELRGYMWT